MRGLAAVVLAVASAAAGCGGSSTGRADAGASKASPSSSVTSAPAPTHAASAEPLSRFEGEAPVKATRGYVEAVGKAVNAGDATLSSVRRLATPAGLKASRYVFRADLAHGYHWPGPEPYTPTAVRTKGDSATVSACMLIRGWSVRAATGSTVGRRTVTPVLFEMRRVAGAWKFDALYTGTGDCRTVEISEVRW
ncbi:MAG TPA: hypothetical protein VHO29_16035 [Marmoricola sp.]|nr:hypothetical protein [Marmoricola sp.]